MESYSAVLQDVTEIPKLGNNVVGGSTHKQELYIASATSIAIDTYCVRCVIAEFMIRLQFIAVLMFVDVAFSVREYARRGL
jgi:hypothetical protein